MGKMGGGQAYTEIIQDGKWEVTESFDPWDLIYIQIWPVLFIW